MSVSYPSMLSDKKTKMCGFGKIHVQNQMCALNHYKNLTSVTINILTKTQNVNLKDIFAPKLFVQYKQFSLDVSVTLRKQQNSK